MSNKQRVNRLEEQVLTRMTDTELESLATQVTPEQTAWLRSLSDADLLRVASGTLTPD